MDSDVLVGTPKTLPFRATVPGLLRDRVNWVDGIGRLADGDVLRLNLGLFRPYLLTSPEHVQRVFADNASNYVREGMFWDPLRRLLGDGLFGEGPAWKSSRKISQPIFTMRSVASMLQRMSGAVAEAVDDMERRAHGQEHLVTSLEMTRLVHATIIRVLFADRISASDADRLIPALRKVGTSVGPRILLPFVPGWVPMPGDRAFMQAVRTVDEVMLPLIREWRDTLADGDTDTDDVVTRLCRARDDHGDRRPERLVRNDVVSLFAAGTETAADALTWLWPILEAHPHVAEQLYDEVDRVLGGNPPDAGHLQELRYTKMVVQEVLRLYSSGWIIPRMAAEADEIGGARIARHATVLVSPYLTHRMQRWWDDPGAFKPDRFLPENMEGRPRFAYIPFGGGPHLCLGNHFFQVEAQLIVATILSRFRPRLVDRPALTPRLGTTLKPPAGLVMVLENVNRG